ncbi:MAG: hypothetical protein V4529_06380 [Gemmatimonadota bacterium]
MSNPSQAPAASGMKGPMSPLWRGLVVALFAVGLLGHLLAASAIGGSRMAYTHHVFGFFLILIVTGVIIVALGRWLWRDRPAVTWLVVSAVQAIFGLIIYLDRFHIA